MSGNNRVGNWSSSSAWKLMTLAANKKDFGRPALSYIKQKKFERKLGRAINKETSARSTSWGTLVELYVFDLLPLDYKLVSTERLVHPTIKTWVGAPDLIKNSTIAEVKCPYSLEVFCEKVGALQSIETYKKEFPEDYYQHISNAILLEQNGFPITHFEAVVFCPYKDELDKIRQLAMEAPPEEAPRYKWLDYAYDSELPYLNKKGEYKNINIFRFPVPDEDKRALTEAVQRAEKILNPSIILISPGDDCLLVEKA